MVNVILIFNLIDKDNIVQLNIPMDDIKFMNVRKCRHYFFYYCTNGLLIVVLPFTHEFE